MTIVHEVKIGQKWWSNFGDEAICDDARSLINEDGYTIRSNGDWLLEATASLLISCATKQRVSNTKQHFKVLLTQNELDALHNHADWYASHYYECASEAWDKSERMQLLAKSRSSAAFFRYLHAEFYSN